MNQIDLSGKHAVVTGGAQGIGLAVATRLLASGTGVAIWDYDHDLLTKTVADLKQYGTVMGITVDITDATAVEHAATRTVDELGGLDIAVNNAGIAGMNTTTWEYPVDEWQRVMDINLNGVYYCCRAQVLPMLENGYGRIVNIASIAGKEGNPNAVAYSASKAGVIALTKSIAKETADKNIAVNCVTPAAAKTRIFDQMSDEHINYMLAKIPRGRFLQVNEAANMIAWMVSEENSFTTGAVFDLSGGRATY